MFGLDSPTFIAVVAAAITISLSLFNILNRVHRTSGVSPAIPAAPVSRPVFLFDGTDLVDASPSGRRLIADRPTNMSEYDALMNVMNEDFPTLRRLLSRLDDNGQQHLVSEKSDDLDLSISDADGLRRLVFGAQDKGDVSNRYEALRCVARDTELNRLRDLTDRAPQLIWTEDASGNLTWANQAYLRYADRVGTDSEWAETVWPEHSMFEGLSDPDPRTSVPPRDRASIQLHNEKAEHWFDVTTLPQGDGVLRYAVEASEAVRAENTQREFRQTLGKTFADLSIGLAIFDKRRLLTMFNPALLDMTDLPFEFLSARPGIDMVLDRLRDMRKLPEPRNYASWRDQFTAWEEAAEAGTYSENWDLPDGQTLRVTGRPHPDGAIAFLFEDITTEVSLTRQFRVEIETSQSVLDSIDDAIVVFSSGNTMVVSNAAHRELWDMDDSDLLVATDLKAALRVWKTASLPAPIWRRIEEFADAGPDRSSWSDTVMLTDGRQATCHASALPGGMTMFRFVLGARAKPLVMPHTAGKALQAVGDA